MQLHQMLPKVWDVPEELEVRGEPQHGDPKSALTSPPLHGATTTTARSLPPPPPTHTQSVNVNSSSENDRSSRADVCKGPWLIRESLSSSP